MRFEGVDVAAYNHWCNVRYSVPELVRTRLVLGIQLYDIRLVPKEVRIPLPNTFQPYARVGVRVR